VSHYDDPERSFLHDLALIQANLAKIGSVIVRTLQTDIEIVGALIQTIFWDPSCAERQRLLLTIGTLTGLDAGVIKRACRVFNVEQLTRIIEQLAVQDWKKPQTTAIMVMFAAYVQIELAKM
jgi:hypothetical protein